MRFKNINCNSYHLSLIFAANNFDEAVPEGWENGRQKNNARTELEMREKQLTRKDDVIVYRKNCYVVYLSRLHVSNTDINKFVGAQGKQDKKPSCC